MSDKSRELRVLVVDDNPADVRLVADAFDECPFPHRIFTAQDGLEAIAFIAKIGKFESAPTPDLVIVDLNMPRIDGYGVLAAIKQTRLHTIPVIVFSTSDDPADVNKAYDLHANCYITKPFDLETFVSAICSAASFWGQTATLPPVTPALAN